jgi:hypothetical protein
MEELFLIVVEYIVGAAKRSTAIEKPIRKNLARV